MQKILLAMDAMKTDRPSLDFAAYLARLTRSTLTGVFLENLLAEQKPVLKEDVVPHLDWQADAGVPEYREKAEASDKHIALFKEACCQREINCHIHRDRGIPSREVVRESRFADLVVLNAATSFNKIYEGVPTEFVKEVLQNAECPVVVAPQNGDTVIEEIIFAYDGSQASMFAIRQFGYLFPELRTKKAILLEVTEEAGSLHYQHKVKEWLQAHYTDCSCKTLSGDVKDQLFSYLLTKQNAIVIMGAYGRSGISSFFRKSNADIILKTTGLPVFITHP